MISSLIILIVSGILISVFLKNYQLELSNEKNRMKRYLSSSISLSLNSIQDEIVNLYYSLSTKINEDMNSTNRDNLEIEHFLSEKKHLSTDFPNILEYIYLIKLKSMIELLPLYRSVWNEYELLRYLYLWETSYKMEGRQLIYIQNLSGFMAYPLTWSYDGDVEEILLLGLSLGDAIQNYLPGIITSKLSENLIKSKNEAVDFDISIQTGKDLSASSNMIQNDMVIDLNEVFNLQKIETYFLFRAQRDLQKITSDTFLSKHLYLIIRHKQGGISGYYSTKYYKAVFIVFAMALLFEILVQMIGIIHYKTLQNHQMEQEFMTLVSHELNTPLCVISLCAENLSQGLFSREKGIQFYGDMIKRESDRLRIMVRNILLISNQSYSCREEDFRNENISDIISDLHEKTNDLLEIHQVSLEIENTLESGYIYCSRHLIVIALFNILENSIKYGAAIAQEKVVYINFSNQRIYRKKYISIIIRDSGPGISIHEYKKVFRNFYRGHNVRNKQLPGSGLGLPLSRYIINEHSGKISLVNKEEKGITFEILLPIGESDEKSNVDRR